MYHPETVLVTILLISWQIQRGFKNSILQLFQLNRFPASKFAEQVNLLRFVGRLFCHLKGHLYFRLGFEKFFRDWPVISLKG